MSMYTISDLRKILGLGTTNQVRNRIEAIKDVLADHLRRGPNNQILISEAGAELLRRLQGLYDSGLTLTEASEVLRSNVDKNAFIRDNTSPSFLQKRMNAEERDELVAALREEIAFLRERIAFLEGHGQRDQEEGKQREWWEHLKEEVDGA